MARPKGTKNMLELIQLELEKPYRGKKKIGWISQGLVNACLPRLDKYQAEAGMGREGEVHADGVIDLKAVETLANRVYGKPAERRSTQIDVFHHYPKLEESVCLEDFSVQKAETQKVIEVEANVE